MPGFTPSSFDFRAPVDSTGPEITSDVDPTNPASVSFHGGVRFDGATSDTVATAQIAPRTVRPSPFFKGNPFVAWKGAGSDRTIYTTTFA